MKKDKTNLRQAQASFIAALSHPIRLEIVDFLAEGPQCVCDICQELSVNRSTVSQHLQVMLRAGLLGCQKDGLKIYYYLDTPCVSDFLNCVNQAVCRKLKQDSVVMQEIESNAK